MEKTLRIWHGCKVVLLLSVGESGYSTMGATGGAGNSTKVDIEIDPWAGLIVDHGVRNPPVSYRDPI
jgi:hypothetical protein